MKRFLALFLSSLMIILTFASCNKDVANKNNGSDSYSDGINNGLNVDSDVSGNEQSGGDISDAPDSDQEQDVNSGRET